MSSIIKVNTLQDANRNALFSTDGSGNVTLSSNEMNNARAFNIANDSNQSIANTTMQKVTFNVEVFDTNNNFASSTFTPTLAGKYFLYSSIQMDINTGTGQIQVRVHKNGSMVARSRQAHFYGNNQQTYCVSAIVEANGSSDYFEIYTYQDSGSSRTLTSEDESNYFMGYRIIGA